MEFRILAVKSQLRKTLRTVMSEIPEKGHTFEQFRILCYNGSPFHSVVQFCGVKTASTDIAVIEYRIAFIPDIEGMRTVIDHLEVFSFGDLVDHFHVTRIAINVGRQYR